jgi:N-methylhydantoinase A
VLGHLPAQAVLADGVALDRDLALAAVSRLAGELGVEPLRAAEGIIEVADAGMLTALRSVTVARGIDQRGYALLPFGGAGPLHATNLAQELGIERILCPRACGVLSALGLAAAPPRRDATGSFEAAAVGTLRERARRELGSEPERERVRYALRYRGQSFELAVDAGPDAGEGELRERFEAVHEREFGYRDEAAAVELVTVTVSVWGPAPELSPVPEQSASARSSTTIWHRGQELEAALILGQPQPGERFEGPAVCALPEATLLVEPGWAGSVLERGAIELVRR